MTSKMLTLAAGLLLLAGCRGPEPREGFWRPSATEQEFAQDYYVCSQRPPTEWCVGWGCIAQRVDDRNRASLCMRSKGWIIQHGSDVFQP